VSGIKKQHGEQSELNKIGTAHFNFKLHAEGKRYSNMAKLVGNHALALDTS